MPHSAARKCCLVAGTCNINDRELAADYTSISCVCAVVFNASDAFCRDRHSCPISHRIVTPNSHTRSTTSPVSHLILKQYSQTNCTITLIHRQKKLRRLLVIHRVKRSTTKVHKILAIASLLERIAFCERYFHATVLFEWSFQKYLKINGTMLGRSGNSKT